MTSISTRPAGQTGPHVRVGVFAGPDPEHRAHAGVLTFRVDEAAEFTRRIEAGEGAECSCYPGGVTPSTFEGPQPWCDVHGQPSAAFEHGQREARVEPAAAGPESWPLTLDQVDEIVGYLFKIDTREGLIFADRLNSAMGRSARRRAKRAAEQAAEPSGAARVAATVDYLALPEDDGDDDDRSPRGFQYACQRLRADGEWEVVGSGPDGRLWVVQEDLRAWQRDVPEGTYRIARRPVADWEPM